MRIQELCQNRALEPRPWPKKVSRDATRQLPAPWHTSRHR
jgi:hypothetical protein